MISVSFRTVLIRATLMSSGCFRLVIIAFWCHACIALYWDIGIVWFRHASILNLWDNTIGFWRLSSGLALSFRPETLESRPSLILSSP